MDFKELSVGRWFDFTPASSDAPTGHFKKTGKRAYLYRHRLGWYEVKIGTATAAVTAAERPDDAPAEQLDVAINFNQEGNAWYFQVQKYKARDGMYDDVNDSFSEGWADADNQGKHNALMEAVRRAKDYARAHVTGPIQAEKVIVFVEGDEFLIVTPHDGKAKIRAGVGNPRHDLNRKR